MNYKSLQEKAKQKGKLLLIESVAYTPEQLDVVRFDTAKLVEDSSGKKFEARGVLKNVPVTRYTENLNGRIYSRELWENVKEKKMFEGSDCLADHAEDDGSVLRTVGVWHNFSVKEDIATADLYCIGESGGLLLEKAKAGGKIGFSTVGFGELSEADPKQVVPESYEFENCDWVRKPSQNVYGTIENIQESVKIIESENKNIENKNTNILEEQKLKEVRNMDKFTEASLKNQIRLAIKEATANENYVEAIRELQEVSKTVPSEMVEEHVKIKESVEAIQSKIDAKRLEAEKQLSESKETLESLQEKYNKANEVIKDLKERLQKAGEIVKKSSSSYSEADIKAMKEDINQFTKDRLLMENDIRILKNEISKRDRDIKCFAEDRDNMLHDLKCYEEDRKEMLYDIKMYEKYLKQAEKHISKLEKVLEDEYGYEFDDVIKDEVYDDTDIITDIAVDTVEDVIEDAYMDGYEDGYDDAVETDIVDEPFIDEPFIDEYVDDTFDDVYMEAEDKDDDEDEEEDEEEDKKKEESKKDKRVQEAVVMYYKEAIKKTPAIKDIKGDILRSRSLIEAVKKVQMFEKKSFGNDTMKLNEKVSNRKFVDYKFKFGE